MISTVRNLAILPGILVLVAVVSHTNPANPAIVFTHVTVIDMTGSPHKRLFLLDLLGTIERGKIADLVLLDANPLENIANTQRINAVVLNGRYLPHTELQTMLRAVEAAANRK